MKVRQAKKIYNNLIKGRKYNRQQARIACNMAMKYFLINYDWQTLKEKKQWDSKWGHKLI